MPTSYNVNVAGGGTIPTADVLSKADVIKSALALDQLNNTSDSSKPVTTALTAALTPFVNISAVGEALNNAPVLEFNFKEDQYITKNTAVAAGTLINGKVGPPAEFTRATGATYKDHVGILRYAPENLTRYSYTFENANWASNAYVTVADSTATDPFGVANNATTITQVVDASVARSRHVNEVTGPYEPTIGQTYCMSVYIKQHETAAARYFQLAFWSAGFGTAAFKNFDIQNKIVSSTDAGSSIISSGIEILSNGWMRIHATAQATEAGYSGFQLAFVSGLSAVRAETNIVFSSPSAAYIHGAQVERSPAPRKYLSTTSSVVYGPRFHYDSVNNTSLGLIFEAEKTNFAHVNDGTINASNTTVTRNYSSVAAPDGSYTSTRVQNTPNQFSVINYLTYDAVADGQYTRSFFVKALSTSAAVVLSANETSEGFFIVFNLINKSFITIRNNGTYVLNYGYEDYGDGWIRLWLSSLKDATHELLGRVWIGWWGSVTDQQDILFWGPQLEAGYVMTSYIPNSATQTLARSQDTCAITGTNFSSFYNPAAGTLCADYRSIQYGARYKTVVSFNDATANSNRIYIGTYGGNNTSSGTDTEFVIATSGTNQYAITTNTAQGVLRKTAFAYSNNTCSSVINGLALTPSVNLDTKTLPIVTRMIIGSAGEIMNISAVRYYKQSLSVSTLQTLTSL
jgi:hypothetical protein